MTIEAPEADRPADAIPHALAKKANSAIAQITQDLAEAASADPAAGRDSEALRGLHQLPPDTVRVLLAGETGTGKSSLVNMLLGRPGLAGVGIGSTTGCPTEYRYGTPESLRVFHPDDSGRLEPREADLLTLHEVTSLGSPDLACLVDVELDSPALHAFSVIDTPGIGGIEGGNGRLALATLPGCAALLFAVEASRPILAPELAFLESAAESVATVIVVVTKIDLTPNFAQVVAETAAHLARRPRLARCSVVAVSSRLAEQAAVLRAAGQDALADKQLELSGIGLLREVLDSRVAGRGLRLHLANGCRVAAAAAGRAADARERVGDGLSIEQQVSALQRERERIAGLLDGERAIRLEVGHLMQELRSEPRHLFDESVTELRRHWRTEAESCPKAELDTLPVKFEAAIAAAAATAMTRQQESASRVAELLAQGLDDRSAGSLLAPLRAGAGETMNLPEVGEAASPPGQTLFAAMSGLGIGRLAMMGAEGALGATAAASWTIATVGGIAVGFLPVAGIVAGAGVALLPLLRSKKMNEQQVRTHIRGWVDSASNEARLAFSRYLDRSSMAVQHELDVHLVESVDALRERMRHITGQQQQLTAAAKPRGGPATDLTGRLRANAKAAEQVANELVVVA